MRQRAALELPRDQVPEPDDDAYFRFDLVGCTLAWPDGHVESFEGVVRGQLVFPPRGDRGFGYDPIFVPEGQTLTYGELDPAVKEADSHRTRAFMKLKAALID